MYHPKEGEVAVGKHISMRVMGNSIVEVKHL